MTMAPFEFLVELSSHTFHIYRILERRSLKLGTWMIVMKIKDFPITRNQRNIYPWKNLLVSIIRDSQLN